MNLKTTNYLNMIGACLNVANDTNYKPVWNGQPPLDFTADLAKVQTGYNAINAKAALVTKASGGAADMKAQAETQLEDVTHLLARALANHFKKTGDLDNLVKVDISKSAIQKLKTLDLTAKCTEILNLGSMAVTQPDAANRGVTAQRVTDVTNAIAAFTPLMSAPRGQIVSRNTLLKEIETDTAALLEQLSDLDDLVIQFNGSDEAMRFQEAWKRARVIIDITGGGNGDDETPPPATPPTN